MHRGAAGEIALQANRRQVKHMGRLPQLLQVRRQCLPFSFSTSCGEKVPEGRMRGAFKPQGASAPTTANRACIGRCRHHQSPPETAVASRLR